MTPVPFPTVAGERLDPDPLFVDGPTLPSVLRIQPPYGGPSWVVTRLDDVKAMLTDRRFSRAATVGVDVGRTQPYTVRENTIIAMDAPHHTRVRRLVSKAFTPRRVEDLRPRTQEIVDGLLDSLETAGTPVDLVEGLALPVPITVICELLGVPYDDRLRFRGWADALMSSSGRTMDEIIEAHGHITEYLAGMIADRRRRRTEDMLSALVHERDDNDALTEEELLGMSLALLVGGFETTASQIAKFVLCLLLHPDQWALLHADPSLVPNAIEELMRLIPLSAGTAIAYVATEDVEFDGITIPAGDTVMASMAAANRDAAHFERPTELDVARSDIPHVGFGHGTHFCLGAQLARMEMQVAVGTLVRRFPGLRLAVEPDALRWKSGSAVWALAELPVEP